MKTLTIILTMVICSNCFAAKKNTKRRHTEKFSYQEYINHFGINDTSKAIIDLYFNKRELCAVGNMSFMPLSMTIALVIPPVGEGLMAISSPLFVSGVITRKKYYYKNLLKELNNYNENNILSKKMNKIMGYLLEEQELYNDDLENNSLTAFQLIRKSE